MAAVADPSELNYAALVRELIEPLLDSPAALRVNCEYAKGRQRVLIRLAFDEADQGRAFGRGGRNIQAIRTVVAAAAALAGQEARVEVFGTPERDRSEGGGRRGSSGQRSSGRRRPPRPSKQRSSG